MPNVFDQFDAPQDRAPPPPAGQNVFDQFDGPPTEKSGGSYAANVGAGINTGLIAGTVGAPVDLATAALNIVPHALGYKGIEHPVGGSDSINALLGKVGLGTEAVPANTPGERIAQEIGRGIGLMLALNALAKAKAITGIAGSAARTVEEALAAGSVPANAAIGAGSGIVGGTAAEVVPDEYKPIAYGVGSILGGVGGAGVAAAGTALTRGAGNLYRSIPPLRATTREAAANANAAGRFRGAASDLTAATDALDTNAAELVPGSIPTTAELSGDVGLLGAQRYREANSPEFGREVVERRGENNTARMNLLEAQAPSLATPEDTQAYLRKFLADNDELWNADVEAHRQNAAIALPPLRITPEEGGTVARGAVEAERSPQGAALAADEQNATAALENATGQIGGYAALGSPEEVAAAPSQFGAAIREPVASAYAAEQQRLRALRDSIDPSGTMGMKPDAIKSAIGKINEMFPAESGGQLSGAERHLYDTASQWGSLIPVERAFQLRANVNGRLRGLQGSDPQEALRLGILKNGVDEAIAQAATDVQAGEQAGVIHQGLPGIQDRLSGGLENFPGIGPNFAQDVARAYAANPATLRAAGRDATGRGILETANGGDESLRAGTSPNVVGAGAGQGRRPGGGAGDQGVPQDAGLTPLTPEARERFAEWNTGYRQMGQTFRGETPGTLHAVGKILQKGGAYDSYRLTDAEVPWLFVNKGPNARAAVDRLLTASPDAAPALDDALAFSLRRAAQKPDGTLDLAKYDAWLKQHGAVVSARPELMQRFSTAAQAQRRLNDIRDAIAQHAADHPLKPGWSDATLLGRFFKPGPEGAQGMREYQRITGDRVDAKAAAEDYAAFSFAQAAVRDGQVVPRLADTWLRQHEQALSAIPGLRERFADATAAQRSVEAAIEAHETARSEFTQSVAGTFLQDDPGRAIDRVFSGANRQQKAALLMDITKGSQSAREGVQRAALDYIRFKIEGGAMPGSEAGEIKRQLFGKFVAQNRDVLSTLFPGRIANFDALAKDLERGSLVVNAKINKGGSDTAELTAGRHGEHGSDIGTATAALLAERVGEHAGHHLLGKLAGTASAVGTVAARMLLGSAKNALKVREDALFDRMLLDPSFAREVLNANPARTAGVKQSIGATFRGRLIQQMLATSQGRQ
jgi:hypothetical protein